MDRLTSLADSSNIYRITVRRRDSALEGRPSRFSFDRKPADDVEPRGVTITTCVATPGTRNWPYWITGFRAPASGEPQDIEGRAAGSYAFVERAFTSFVLGDDPWDPSAWKMALGESF